MVKAKTPKNELDKKTKNFVKGASLNADDYKRFSIGLTNEVFDDLKDLADKDLRSISRQAEFCIKTALEMFKNKNKIENNNQIEPV